MTHTHGARGVPLLILAYLMIHVWFAPMYVFTGRRNQNWNVSDIACMHLVVAELIHRSRQLILDYLLVLIMPHQAAAVNR